MYGYLRQSTAATVLAGPFLSPSDGVTPQTSLTAPAGASSGASSGVALVTGGAAASYTVSGWAHDRLGYYTVSLSTGDTGTPGRLRLEFVDAAHYAPVHMDFVVLPVAIYDWFFGTAAPYTGTPPSAAAIAAAVLTDTTDTLGADILSILAGVNSLTTRIPSALTITGGKIAATVAGGDGADAASALTILSGLVASGDHTQFTTHALANGPSGGGGGLTLATALTTPRALDSVADAAMTVADALWAAVAGVGRQDVSTGTQMVMATPGSGTAIRTSPITTSATNPFGSNYPVKRS